MCLENRMIQQILGVQLLHPLRRSSNWGLGEAFPAIATADIPQAVKDQTDITETANIITEKTNWESFKTAFKSLTKSYDEEN